MNESDRALYQVLGDGPLVRWAWDGPKPARLIVFALSASVVLLTAAALFAESLLLGVADLALWAAGRVVAWVRG